MEREYKPVIGIPGVPVDDYRKMLMAKKCISFMLPPYKDINYYHTNLKEIVLF